MEEKKLFLLDAFALIFRAYYALIRNTRVTSQGKNTNAQFGFTNTLLDLINNHKPTHIAVCFDTKGPTERHTDFSDYKANRQETPEDILLAVPDIKEIIRGFNIPVIEAPGYEADDIIGALSVQAEKAGYEVYMVTPDKDYGQLVSEKVKIFKPSYQGGGFEIMGPKEVCEKWDIERVDQVIDILGLMGDAVDNIPGIAGVGEKTAAKLLKEYGTLENVLDNAHNIKGALGQKVIAGKENAILSKKLATIILNVPCTFHEGDYALGEKNIEALEKIFTELEFKTLAQRLLGKSIAIETKPIQRPGVVQGDMFATQVFEASTINENKVIEKPLPAIANKNISNTTHNYILLKTNEELENLVADLSLQKTICFDTETTSLDVATAELVGCSFCVKEGEAQYFAFTGNRQNTLDSLKILQPLFTNENITWVGQNLKYDMLILKYHGYELKGQIFDTMLAHYVIEPEGKRSMDILSAQYLGYNPVSITELIGKKGKGQLSMKDIDIEEVKEYAAEDADVTFQLYNKFLPLLKTNTVEKVFYEVENPLVKVLTNMEMEGIKIDVNFLQDYSKELEREAKTAEEKVYTQAGVRFNLASPKQLGEVLFDKLKLDPKAKKTKTGQYATGEDILQKLAVQNHQICDDILVFRELTKLRNTYVDALPQLINPHTGRVHTTYAQAVAVTGRLASNNPNLQNIPIRSDRGREIRKAFIPRNKSFLLMSADYSQIELRIVAAISGDINMCEAFKQNKDIHTATAARVYGIPEADVTKEMRYKAKSVNFGIIYGQGAFGLADNLGISRGEAKEIIDNYKKEFSGVTTYMENMIEIAKEFGFVETLMGRKRWLADINSANFTVRGFAERNAINSPIQGTAADMIKMAMIKIDHAMSKTALQSKMILQVHDELIFDVHESEVDIMKELILHNMQTAMILPNAVPVMAEIGFGDNWLEAH